MKSNKHTQSMRNLLKLFQSAFFFLIMSMLETNDVESTTGFPRSHASE